MGSFFPVSLLRIRGAQVSLKSPRPLASDSRTVGPESNPAPALQALLKASGGAWDTAPQVAPPACLLLFPDAGDSSPFSSPAGLGVEQPRLLPARACAAPLCCFLTLPTPMPTVLWPPSLPLDPFTVASDFC